MISGLVLLQDHTDGGKKQDKANRNNTTANYTYFAQNTASFFTTVVSSQSSLYSLT